MAADNELHEMCSPEIFIKVVQNLWPTKEYAKNNPIKTFVSVFTISRLCFTKVQVEYYWIFIFVYQQKNFNCLEFRDDEIPILLFCYWKITLFLLYEPYHPCYFITRFFTLSIPDWIFLAQQYWTQLFRFVLLSHDDDHMALNFHNIFSKIIKLKYFFFCYILFFLSIYFLYLAKRTLLLMKSRHLRYSFLVLTWNHSKTGENRMRDCHLWLMYYDENLRL